MNIEKRVFGVTEGREVDIYTMTVDSGMSVSIITYGGAIVKLLAPNKDGRLADVICGYDCLSSYVEGDGYQGALIGRFGNRIARGKFTLEGKEYTLYTNNGENHLHGGKCGFSHKIWQAESRIESDGCVLELNYVSVDGEEGYPGTLNVTVTYKLSQDNALSISYKATTDKTTVLNLTNHSYFNLGGYASGKVLDHEVWIDAESFLPTDAGLIPTGEIVPVKDTAFDFTEAKTIGRDFDLNYEPLALAGGYDHCINFTKKDDAMAEARIKVRDPKTGREMHVYTDMPAVQFYTGNFLKNEKYPFKGGYPQAPQNAFCLETQKMPDSVNHANFTSCTLTPDEVYKTTTVYKFITE
jgi:aldose 1-epimerase